MLSRILTIAGSDSGGGAGIQADIHAIANLGGYAMTAITALTAQNTQGVFGIHEVPLPFIRQQIEVVLADIGADAIKTGMLHSAGVIHTVAETLAAHPTIPLVIDPVMISTSGGRLLEEDAIAALKTFIARATLVTPNIPEAALLAGQEIHTLDDMRSAGKRILALGAKAILVKGGHGTGEIVHNMLITPEGDQDFTTERIHTIHTHGTGCTLASAITCLLGQGKPLAEAVAKAIAYVHEGLLHPPGIGKGHGPVGQKAFYGNFT